MSSEEVSLIASQPFIRKFVFAIIQNIRAKNFDYDERHVVHADLVPRVSEKVMQASLREKITSPRPEIISTPILPKRDMSALVAPIPEPVKVTPQPGTVPRAMPQIQITQRVIPSNQQMPVPNISQDTGLSQDYGKITPLLNDPSISTIECSGEGKPLMIIRAGQKMSTRIVLNAKEIKEILEKVSDTVHIPLLEGVFRAAVDNFSINAVISEIIGSRFIIKKQTAYALLER